MQAKFRTNYSRKINETLKVPAKKNGFKVVDLFAGCGGLALGFESAGFETIGFEMNPDCAATYESNLGSKCHITKLDTNTKYPSADVVVGGPPCQPFSVGGEQKGAKDDRDGFPAFIACVTRIKPKVWVFENVRGLLYKNRPYFDNILAQLTKLGYTIEFKLLNAADYDVPQTRERLFVVGHKSIFSFPEPAGIRISAGEALGSAYQYAPESGKYFTRSMDTYVRKYEIASKCARPRDLHPEIPSRTVTCRNLAGATGDMLRIKLPDGRRRRLETLEAARLQSFPDSFSFKGNELSIFNQIGNAVPPMLAFHVAREVLKTLTSKPTRKQISERKRASITQMNLNI